MCAHIINSYLNYLGLTESLPIKDVSRTQPQVFGSRTLFQVRLNYCKLRKKYLMYSTYPNMKVNLENRNLSPVWMN